jgi:small subunit ribosomal protein S17e
MGRVRTKTVKRAAKVLLEKHYQKLTNDFHINKRILSEVAKVPTKRLRNKIAGFATHLVKRIQRGPVKGISLKVQEEERERRLDWVPKQSEIQTEKVQVDNETSQMLKSRFGEDFFNQVSANIEVRVPEQQRRTQKTDKRRGPKGDRKPREQKGEQPAATTTEQPATTQQPAAQQTQEKPAEKKREARRRGPREGQ